MAKKVTLDNLGQAIEEALKDYADDVFNYIPRITDTVAQKGATAIKNEAKAKFKDRGKGYAKGWGVEKGYVRGRLRYSTVIRNKVYQLPHLLEYGHANRDGGRTQGRPHIKPVEKKIAKLYEREIIHVIK